MFNMQAIIKANMERTEPCKCGGVYRRFMEESRTNRGTSTKFKFECDRCGRICNNPPAIKPKKVKK